MTSAAIARRLAVVLVLVLVLAPTEQPPDDPGCASSFVLGGAPGAAAGGGVAAGAGSLEDGADDVPQCPALQASPFWHVPHEAPQPSSPHSLFAQRSTAGGLPVGVPARSVCAKPSAIDAPEQSSPIAVKPSMNAPYGGDIWSA